MKKMIFAVIVVLAVFMVGCNPFTPTYHTVTFDTLGGSTVASVQVQDGMSVDQPTNPTKAGCMFTGWSWNFSNPITEDITITANAWDTTHDEALITGSPWTDNFGTFYTFNTTSFTLSMPDNGIITVLDSGTWSTSLDGWITLNGSSPTTVTYSIVGNTLTINGTIYTN